MPWVRFDDQFPIHRKVSGLTDAEYRLHTEAIFWCARNETGGVVGNDELRLIMPLRHPRKHVTALVERELWIVTGSGWFIPQGNSQFDWWSIERDDYRKKIPHDVRRLVYERDEGRCGICGSTEDLTLDHIHPWSLGGPDTEENLRVLCRSCNSRKGAHV